MASIVLDSSAILAHLNDEPGSERAAPFFGNALISAVNLAEIVAKLAEHGASLNLIRAALSWYGLHVAALGEGLAERTGAFRIKNGLPAFARPRHLLSVSRGHLEVERT